MNRKLGKVMFFFALLQPLVALTWKTDVVKNLSWYDALYWPLFALMGAALAMTLISGSRNRFNVNGWVALLVLNGLISVAINAGKLSILDFSFIASFMVLFFTAPYVVTSEQKFVSFAKALLVILIVPAVIGYLQRLGVVPYDYLPDWIGQIRVNRLTGGYSHPNTYGYYFTFGIAAALYLYQIGKLKWYSLVAWLLFIIPTVFYTYHRATWITTMAIFFVYLVAGAKRKNKLSLIIPLSVFALFAGRIVAGLSTGFEGGDLRGRGFIYALYLAGYLTSSIPRLLFGHGSPHIKGFGVLGAHDDYLNALYIYGLSGLTVLLVFITGSAVKLIHRYRVATGGRKALSLFGMVLLLIYFLFSITAEPMREYYFYFFFAISLSYVDWFTSDERTFQMGRAQGRKIDSLNLPGGVGAG